MTTTRVKENQMCLVSVHNKESKPLYHLVMNNLCEHFIIAAFSDGLLKNHSSASFVQMALPTQIEMES
jgi:hypothetical protein